MEFEQSHADAFASDDDDDERHPDRIWLDPFAWMQFAYEAPEYIDYTEFHSFTILELGDLAAAYNGDSVVIRIKDMSTSASRLMAMREWQRWRTMAHRNIVELIGVSILSGQALAFIFPALPSLAEVHRTSKIDEVRAMQIAANVANALQFIHKRRIIHGDLTPMSIVLSSDDKAQLIGFGEDDDTGFASYCRLASLEYAAPEVISADLRGPCGFTCRVDIWSLGIILSELINGSLVWPIEPGDDFYQRLVNGMRPYLPPGLSAALRETIESCLEVHARRRPTAESLLERLTMLIKWRKGNTANATLVRAQKTSCQCSPPATSQMHRARGCRSNAQIVYLHSASQLGEGAPGSTRLNLEHILLLQKILRILGCDAGDQDGGVLQQRWTSMAVEGSESRGKKSSTTASKTDTDTKEGGEMSDDSSDMMQVEGDSSQNQVGKSSVQLATIFERIVFVSLHYFWVCTVTFASVFDMIDPRFQ